jgi:multisubunit Na+/H+ antiporter MnhG subunit
VIDALLLLTALAVWIGCLGFGRLRSAFERLHCATFVALSAGPLVVAAAVWADGFSDRAGKIALLVVLAAFNSAASGHAVARAIAWRDAGGDRSEAGEDKP